MLTCDKLGTPATAISSTFARNYTKLLNSLDFKHSCSKPTPIAQLQKKITKTKKTKTKTKTKIWGNLVREMPGEPWEGDVGEPWEVPPDVV